MFERARSTPLGPRRPQSGHESKSNAKGQAAKALKCLRVRRRRVTNHPLTSGAELEGAIQSYACSGCPQRLTGTIESGHLNTATVYGCGHPSLMASAQPLRESIPPQSPPGDDLQEHPPAPKLPGTTTQIPHPSASPPVIPTSSSTDATWCKSAKHQ